MQSQISDFALVVSVPSSDISNRHETYQSAVDLDEFSASHYSRNSLYSINTVKGESNVVNCIRRVNSSFESIDSLVALEMCHNTCELSSLGNKPTKADGGGRD